jgi:hypothetical protein
MYLSFMYGLFEDVQCHRHYRGSVCSVQRIRKDVKGGYGNLVFFLQCPVICVGGLRKLAKTFSQGREFPGRGLKSETPVYKLTC